MKYSNFLIFVQTILSLTSYTFSAVLDCSLEGYCKVSHTFGSNIISTDLFTINVKDSTAIISTKSQVGMESLLDDMTFSKNTASAAILNIYPPSFFNKEITTSIASGVTRSFLITKNTDAEITLTDTMSLTFAKTIIIKGPYVYTKNDKLNYFQFDVKYYKNEMDKITFYINNIAVDKSVSTIPSAFTTANEILSVDGIANTLSSFETPNIDALAVKLTDRLGKILILKPKSSNPNSIIYELITTNSCINKGGNLLLNFSYNGIIHEDDIIEIFIGSKEIGPYQNQCKDVVVNYVAKTFSCSLTPISTITPPKKPLRNPGVLVEYNTSSKTVITSLDIYKGQSTTIFNGSYNIALKTRFCPIEPGFHYKFLFSSTENGNVTIIPEGTTTKVVDNVSFIGHALSDGFIKDLSFLEMTVCHDIEINLTHTAGNVFNLSMIKCPNTKTVMQCTTDMGADVANVTNKKMIFKIPSGADLTVMIKTNLFPNGQTVTFAFFSNDYKSEVYEKIINDIPELYGEIEVIENVDNSEFIILSNKKISITSTENPPTVNYVYLGHNNYEFIDKVGLEYFFLPPKIVNTAENLEILMEVTNHLDNTKKSTAIQKFHSSFNLIDTFPKVTAITITESASTFTIKFTLPSATPFDTVDTYLTTHSLSPSSVNLDSVKWGNNTQSTLTGTLPEVIAEFTKPIYFDHLFSAEILPILITNLGKLEEDTALMGNLCNNTITNLISLPSFACNCTNKYDALEKKCITTNCPNNQTGVSNNTNFCNFCQEGTAFEGNCVLNCPSKMGKNLTNDINAETYYCVSCNSTHNLKENDFCVSSCSEGYGLKSGDNETCFNCSSLGMVEFNRTCVNKCPFYKYKHLENELAFCKSCNSSMYAQNEECVSNCTRGYAISNFTENSINLKGCYNCTSEGKFEKDFSCVNACESYQISINPIMNTLYCDFCPNGTAIFNNTCSNECPMFTSISNVIYGNNTRTVCKMCNNTEFYYSVKCEKNCVGSIQNYTNLGECVSKCPDATVNYIPKRRNLEFLKRLNNDININRKNANTLRNLEPSSDYNDFMNFILTYNGIIPKMCFKCPEKAPFIYNNECIASCPDGKVANKITKQCESCATGKFFYLDECSDICPENHIIESNNCIPCSKSSRPISFEGRCVDSCPLAFYPVKENNMQTCKSLLQMDDCPLDFCSNSGTCSKDLLKIFICECRAGYTGLNCQLSTSQKASLIAETKLDILYLKYLFTLSRIDNSRIRPIIYNYKSIINNFGIAEVTSDIVANINIIYQGITNYIKSGVTSINVSDNEKSIIKPKYNDVILGSVPVSNNTTNTTTNATNTTNTNSTTNTTNTTNATNTTNTNNTTNTTLRFLQANQTKIDYDIILDVIDLQLSSNLAESKSLTNEDILLAENNIKTTTKNILDSTADFEASIKQNFNYIFDGISFSVTIFNVKENLIKKRNLASAEDIAKDLEKSLSSLTSLTSSSLNTPNSAVNSLLNIGGLLAGTALSLGQKLQFTPNSDDISLQSSSYSSESYIDFSNCTFSTTDSNYKKLRNLQTTSNSTTSTTTGTTTSSSIIADTTKTYYVLYNFKNDIFNDIIPSSHSHSERMKIEFVHSNVLSNNVIIKPKKDAIITPTCANGYNMMFPYKNSKVSLPEQRYLNRTFNLDVINKKGNFFNKCYPFPMNSLYDMPYRYRFTLYNAGAICPGTCKYISIDKFFVKCSCTDVINKAIYYQNYFTSEDETNIDKGADAAGFIACVSTGFLFLPTNYGFFAVMAFIGLVLIGCIVSMIMSCSKGSKSSSSKNSNTDYNQGRNVENVGQINIANFKLQSSEYESTKKQSVSKSIDIKNEESIFSHNLLNKKIGNELKFEYDPSTERMENEDGGNFKIQNNYDSLDNKSDNLQLFENKNEILNNSPIRVGVGADEYRTFNANHFDQFNLIENEGGNFIEIKNENDDVIINDNDDISQNKDNDVLPNMNNFMSGIDTNKLPPNKVGDLKYNKLKSSKKEKESKLKSNNASNKTRPESNSDNANLQNNRQINEQEDQVQDNKNEKTTYDKLSFCSYFWMELKSNHLVLRIFLNNNPFKPLSLRVCSFGAFYSLIFMFNCIFFFNSTVVALAGFKAVAFLNGSLISYFIAYELIRVTVSLYLSIIIMMILSCIVIAPKNLYTDHAKDINNEIINQQLSEKYFSEAKIRIIIYYILVLLILIFSFLYSTGFGGAYPKTTIEYALGGGIGLLLHMLLIQPINCLIKTIFSRCG